MGDLAAKIHHEPIESIDEDLFGRRGIVDSISKTIVERSMGNQSCYTIGIYGKWGEGKTSLLNMVCEKISCETNIHIVKFNPWLFKDQESLLLDFFKALEKGNSKAVVKKIKQYGPLVSLGISGLLNIALPGLGNVVNNSLKQLTKAISKIDIDIRQLKKELNKSIQQSGKHLLILIDDVDRLDKDEMHALFKLIRQNADFVNTTYLIAMDVDMVAKSIGKRFENGDEASGKHFLEKIVHVPIYLPKIQRGHLNKIIDDMISKQLDTLFSTDTIISTPQRKELNDKLHRYVYPLFSTVREIILYTNSLFFILPLVYREVNLSDLCLLEALKLFHPDGYYRIRDNKYIITGIGSAYFSKYVLESDEQKRKRREQFIDSLLSNIKQEQQALIEEIIDDILAPFISPTNNNNLSLHSHKRLCSSSYFDKYFLYTTPDDMISDIESDEFVKNIPSINIDNLLAQLEYYYNRFGYNELKRMIYQMLYMKYFNTIDNDSVEKICVALSRMSVNKKRKDYTFDETDSHFEIFICDIIERYVNNLNPVSNEIIPNDEKKLQIVERILSEKELTLFHLFFAAHLCDKCGIYYVYQEKFNKMVCNLIKRYILQNKIDPLFELDQIPTTILFGIWKEENPEDYKKQVDTYIVKEEFNVIPFIQKMIYNSEENYYNMFCKLFDADEIFRKVKDINPSEISHYNTTVGYFIRRHQNKQQIQTS
ncbi:KAP family P-loop domain-containing protein [Porphyromonadaceae bacterium KH3CP3RA]|nr:KAP family P-loop domain-containing protein [Porphyromonadaceae bacterium KH3CP3RA]